MVKRLVIAASLILLLIPICAEAGDLPDPKLTPGVARSGIEMSTLCPIAHTPDIRNVNSAEKRQVYAEYGMAAPRTGYCDTPQGCEVDHLISLEIGGSNAIQNLWPQTYDASPWNARVKDKLENKLHALVCAGAITLIDAQRAVATNWIEAYKKYVGPDPK